MFVNRCNFSRMCWVFINKFQVEHEQLEMYYWDFFCRVKLCYKFYWNLLPTFLYCYFIFMYQCREWSIKYKLLCPIFINFNDLYVSFQCHKNYRKKNSHVSKQLSMHMSRLKNSSSPLLIFYLLLLLPLEITFFIPLIQLIFFTFGCH